jgi:hypothetical protein
MKKVILGLAALALLSQPAQAGTLDTVKAGAVKVLSKAKTVVMFPVRLTVNTVKCVGVGVSLTVADSAALWVKGEDLP